jgi:hypothetical protein
MLLPVIHTTPLASRMNSGPYGAGVVCQNGSTFSRTASRVSTPGPTVYGSNPCSGRVP